MKMRWVAVAMIALALGACVKQRTKHMYAGSLRPGVETAMVYPSMAPGALVMIAEVDGVRTFEMVAGNSGPVVVLPGTHTFKIQAFHGIDSPKGELPPEGATVFPFSIVSGALLASEYSANVEGTVEAGGIYEIRYAQTADKAHVVYFTTLAPSAAEAYNKKWVGKDGFQPKSLKAQ